jgi:hypothetical protein
MSMPSVIATLSNQQQPPAHILQSWRREHVDLRDRFLLQQTFIVAPDTAVPYSKLRQRIRDIYAARTKPIIAVHYNSRKSATQVQTIVTTTKDLVKSHPIL